MNLNPALTALLAGKGAEHFPVAFCLRVRRSVSSATKHLGLFSSVSVLVFPAINKYGFILEGSMSVGTGRGRGVCPLGANLAHSQAIPSQYHIGISYADEQPHADQLTMGFRDLSNQPVTPESLGPVEIIT